MDLSSIQRRIAGPRGCWARVACYAAAAGFAIVALAAAAAALAQDGDTDSAEPAFSAGPASPLPSAGALVAVHGVVRNAVTGEPLPRALVRIEGDASTGALTDGDGRFEIPNLPAGPQIFEVVKPGFLDRPNAGGRVVLDDAGSAHNVLVAAGMADLAFSLTPTNAIHGQVGLSTGDPAEGIEVQLLRRTVQDGRAIWQQMTATKTLSDGGYRFAGLPNGQYAVYTNPAMDNEEASNVVAAGRAADVVREGYASQFFPDSRDLAGAAKIHLANGEEAQANINLTLEPFHTVTATATFPEDLGAADRQGMNFLAEVSDAEGHQLPYTAQYDQATHTIQALLPDGTYSLRLSAMARFLLRQLPGGPVRAISANPWPYVGSAEFSVAGHAVSNLRVPLSVSRPSSVQLNVQHAGSSAPQNPNGSVVVTASLAGGWISDGASTALAHGNQAGSLDVEYTPPGSYWMHTRVAMVDLCESSFTAGGVHLAREPLTIGLSGATAPLDLSLRDDCAKLTLALPASLSSLSAGEEPFFTVYVVPDFDSTTDVDPVTLRPTSGGTMTLEALTPGSYHVYTFLGPVELEYRNRDALAGLPEPGQQITLSPGQTSSLVLEAPAH